MPDDRVFAVAIHDGSYDRVHYGLVMASAAAAIGRPTHLLFAGDSVKVLGTISAFPEQDMHNQSLGIASLDELLTACRDLGARLLVCETALLLADLEKNSLRDDLNLEIGGFVGFLNGAGSDAQLVFV